MKVMNSATVGVSPAFVTSNEYRKIEMMIEDGERRLRRHSKGVIHLDDGKTCISNEMNCLVHIERADELARRIANGDEVATRMQKGIHGDYAYTLTRLGRAIWNLCREGVPMIEQASPSTRYKGRCSAPVMPVTKPDELAHTEDMKAQFNPYIAVMLRACQKVMPTLMAYGGLCLDMNDRRVRNKLERMIRFVRRVCRSEYFRRMEDSRSRLERKNLRSCCLYMAEGFRQYSCLNIARVDLYVRPSHKAWGDTRLAKKCLDHFLRALSEDRIVPDVKRWICKRECGFDRGIHYHLLVAMDGHKHQSTGALSKMIGDAWMRFCGPIRASYFNCFIRRKQYKYNALGSVHISDRWMLTGIKEAIRYMVKGDGFVMSGHKRNIRRGIGCSLQAQIKRGAPRKACHDMSIVNEILGDVTS
jgi:hypothetical protein